MALNFNLMNTDLPGQIASSFQQGYQGAQDRTNVLEQREQQKRTQLAQLIQNGAKSIAASPSAYKSIFARVKKVAGVPLDDDEKRYDEAFATSGEEGVKKLAMADADFDMQTVLSLRDREGFEAYLKGQQPAAQPTNALTAARVAPGALGSGTFDPTVPAAPVNALTPTAQTPVTQTPTNALAPTAQVNSAEAIEAQIAQLSRFNDPRAAIEIKRLERQLTAMEPTADVKTMRALNIPLTPAGYEQYRQAQRQEQLTFQQRKELAREGRSITGGGGGGRAPSGYRFTPSGELEAIPGGPAAAALAVKPMTALQQQKANKERVAEQQGVEAARTTANELEKLTDELAGNPEKGMPPHPGYKRIIGFESMVGSLPSGDAARAEQKLETFKSKISTFGRQLATQYGKLGNMAVQEWKIVSDAVQNISPRAGNLDEQMRDVVRQARDFELSMQNKYDDLYGDEGEQPSAPTGAKPTTAPKTTGNPYSNLSNEELLKQLSGGK